MTRGRLAHKPRNIPYRGWLDIMWRIKTALVDNHVSLVAAGIAFFTLLALFPAIAVVLAIGGLAVDTQTIVAQIDQLQGIVPPDVLSIIQTQATDVSSTDSASLGFAVLSGTLLSLWSASRAVANLVNGLNMVYDEDEKRGLIRLNLEVLALTIGLIIVFVIAIASIVALPALLAYLQLPVIAAVLASLFRWIAIAAVMLFGLALLYRFGPSRTSAEWRWVTSGSATACILWFLASVGFTYYVTNLASYNESFGTLGGIIVLIIWLWISAFVVLLGATINAEIEAQTKIDTTVGPDRPMGQRGAVKADTLGETISETRA